MINFGGGGFHSLLPPYSCHSLTWSRIYPLTLDLATNLCSGKESTCQCRRHKCWEFHPWFRKIPLRRKWQPTPVFLLGKSHRQRSLAGYSPRGHKDLDMTERLRTHTSLLWSSIDKWKYQPEPRSLEATQISSHPLAFLPLPLEKSTSLLVPERCWKTHIKSRATHTNPQTTVRHRVTTVDPQTHENKWLLFQVLHLGLFVMAQELTDTSPFYK